MKNAYLTLLAVLAAFTPLAKAQETVVRWNTIVGVITALNVDNPVAGTSIHSGTLPWTTLGGKARVNLTTGAVMFDVDGLVLNGGERRGYHRYSSGRLSEGRRNISLQCRRHGYTRNHRHTAGLDQPARQC
jgi:hypothetical protein